MLPELGNQTMFSYWQSRLTDVFIEDIKESRRHTLQFGASDEMKALFDWKRVEKEGACHHSRISSMEEWKIGFDSDIYQNVPW